MTQEEILTSRIKALIGELAFKVEAHAVEIDTLRAQLAAEQAKPKAEPQPEEMPVAP